MSASTFTFEEVERMRKAIIEHDKENMPRNFDLNNPPKVPYRHQEFPKVVYMHGPDGNFNDAMNVKNKAELDEALADGWSLSPRAETVEADKPRRGRPPKAE